MLITVPYRRGSVVDVHITDMYRNLSQVLCIMGIHHTRVMHQHARTPYTYWRCIHSTHTHAFVRTYIPFTIVLHYIRHTVRVVFPACMQMQEASKAPVIQFLDFATCRTCAAVDTLTTLTLLCTVLPLLVAALCLQVLAAVVQAWHSRRVSCFASLYRCTCCTSCI